MSRFGNPTCITVVGFGFTSYVNLEDFITNEIQDDDEGLRVARELLASQDTYHYNEDAEYVYVRHFHAFDADELLMQVEEWERLMTETESK